MAVRRSATYRLRESGRVGKVNEREKENEFSKIGVM